MLCSLVTQYLVIPHSDNLTLVVATRHTNYALHCIIDSFKIYSLIKNNNYADEHYYYHIEQQRVISQMLESIFVLACLLKHL